MFPIVSVVGIGEIRTHTIFLALAVIVGNVLGTRLAARLEQIDPATTRRVLLWLAIPAFVGGHLHYMLNYGLPLWAVPRVWTGLHASGAITAVVLSAPIVCRFYGMSVWKIADGVTPAMMIAIAIARIGCFLNGCCFGEPCSLPWCMSFPGSAGTVHPLQLYFAGTSALVAVGAMKCHPRKMYDGQIVLWAGMALSASLFGLEFLRSESPSRIIWGPLPELAWTSLSLIILFPAIAFWRRAASERPKVVASLDSY